MPLAAVATSCPARLVEQQHGGGVGLEHFLHPLEQGLEQCLLVEPGQRGVRHRFDVAQPVSGQPLGVRIVGKGESHGSKLLSRTLRNNCPAPRARGRASPGALWRAAVI